MAMCQSCGVPFENGLPHFGTNADGTPNEDYCASCYMNGDFTEELTVEQVIERQIPYLLETNPGLGKQQAKDTLVGFIPGLKRWHE